MGKIQKLCCCCCWNDCLSRSADGENGRESRKSRRARVDRFTSPDWSERLLSTVSKCFWASLDSYFNSQQYLTVSLKSLSAFVGCLRLQLLMLRPRASIRMGQLTSCRSLSSAAFSLYTHTRILSVCVCVCVGKGKRGRSFLGLLSTAWKPIRALQRQTFNPKTSAGPWRVIPNAEGSPHSKLRLLLSPLRTHTHTHPFYAAVTSHWA
jgi:hypothetical protein